jgi:hypothetical protein
MEMRNAAATLLKRVIEDLRKENARAAETFACKNGELIDNFPSGPMGLYLKLGFKISKKRESYPLMRLELI